MIDNVPMQLDVQQVKHWLGQFPQLTLGLIGDLFLDRYLDIEPDTEEFSVETGYEAYQVQSIRNYPGALGTIINNLLALGVGRLVPLTVIGDDGHGHDLVRALKLQPRVDLESVIRCPHRLTPTYTKPMRRLDGKWIELNRLDIRSRAPLDSATESLVLSHLGQLIDRVDGLIVLDQINERNWGVINEEVRQGLEEFSSASDRLIYIDSRMRLGDFSNGILKGNQREILRAAGFDSQDLSKRPSIGDSEIPDRIDHSGPDQTPVDPNLRVVAEAATRLTGRTGQPVFCTCGSSGIIVAEPRSEARCIPTVQLTGPIDIVGAGDSATSGIVPSLLAGATPCQAAAIGNIVASITVRQLGTTGTATPSQVVDSLH